MKVAETFSVDFIIRRSKTTSTEALVYARVCVNGKRKEISLKESIPYSSWDSAREVMKGSGERTKSLNKYIQNVKNKLTNIYRDLKDSKVKVSAQTIKDYYLQQGEFAPKRNTLISLIDYHNKINDGILAKGTLKNYFTTKLYVQRFLEYKYQLNDFFLDELDMSFITELEFFIRKVPLKKHDPCDVNGVAKHIERIKKIIKWGKKLEWLNNMPFDGFRVIKKKSKREKLTLTEVKLIAARKFSNQMLSLSGYSAEIDHLNDGILDKAFRKKLSI
jgi:hypothetical protein